MTVDEAERALISNEFNAKALKIKSEPIKVIDNKVKELASILVKTMLLTDGVGIAAPQLGVYKRIIAYIGQFGEINVLINPKITYHKGIQTVEEGCLSFPNIWGNVDRPQYVVVEAQDLDGKKIIVRGKDMTAAVLSHEIDHLDGILFIDKIKGKITDPFGLKKDIYDVSNKMFLASKNAKDLKKPEDDEIDR